MENNNGKIPVQLRECVPTNNVRLQKPKNYEILNDPLEVKYAFLKGLSTLTKNTP